MRKHFSYDARSRIVSQTKRIPDPVFLSTLNPQPSTILVSFITGYTYDSMDRVVALTYPDGDVVTNLYNPRGLLTRITGGPSGSIISNITYRASAQLNNIRYGNAVLTSYDYDPRLRLRQLHTLSATGGEGGGEVDFINFTYDFDGVSNIRAIHDNRPLSVIPANDPRRNTQIFDYDSLYRLTGAEYPAILAGSPGRIDYRYDRIGNMVFQRSNIPHVEDGKSVTDLGTMTSGGAAGSSGRIGKGTQPGPHALTSITQPSTNHSQRLYPYDANGNMADIDSLTNTWDFKDRLIAVENDKMRAEYTYDYTDRRIMKRVWSKTSTNLQPLAFSLQPSSVLYINKFFEMREHDSPVKYVWNGETRVARVTGTLSPSTERRQFLRIHPGWNLASINVGNAQAQLDPVNQPLLQTGVFWTNNAPGGEFLPITAATLLSAGTVAWLQANQSGVLTLTGLPPGEPPDVIDPAGPFLANVSGEALDVASVIPSDARASRFDGQAQNWQERLPSPLAVAFDARLKIPTGEAVVLKPMATNILNWPSPALSIRYYHQDHLGSSSVLSDNNASLVEETSNYAFGQPRTLHRPRGLSEAFTFTQKELDGETGMHYFETRLFLASLARFVRSDVLAKTSQNDGQFQPQHLNRYAYCNNRPIFLVDADGCEGKQKETVAERPKTIRQVNEERQAQILEKFEMACTVVEPLIDILGHGAKDETKLVKGLCKVIQTARLSSELQSTDDKIRQCSVLVKEGAELVTEYGATKVCESAAVAGGPGTAILGSRGCGLVGSLAGKAMGQLIEATDANTDLCRKLLSVPKATQLNPATPNSTPVTPSIQSAPSPEQMPPLG